MKCAILILSFLCALSSPASADSGTQDIPAFPSSCSETPYGETCLHAFGGAMTRIPLPEEQAAQCDGREVQLYQLSSRLAAPVGEPMRLERGKCDAVSLYLPEVREKTAFRLTLLPAKSHAEEGALVIVYPADIWGALREWSESNQLIVNDRDNRLLPILERRHIAYSTFAMPLGSNHRRVCIWVPREGGDDEAPPFDCASTLVLHETDEGWQLLPQIIVVHLADGMRTDVHMPILKDMPSSPVLQQTFIDLIQSQL